MFKFAGIFWAVMGLAQLHAADVPQFNRDVRPILSEHCFRCHGPDSSQRMSELRLDTRDSALAQQAIVPGKPASSQVIARIFAVDDDQVMPPPEVHRRLSEHEKQTLRRWIAAGANYEKHWAFVPPRSLQLPQVSLPGAEIINPIDVFIQNRLAHEGLRPAPAASKPAFIRRVTLDLTGLPPTPEETAAFLQDSSDGAYEKVVDRLLASVHYGERMAVDWLDAARYADTNGYQVDRDRELWPWRDWVIRAFNDNMPFDQFTIEQLAGDLLPNATLEQRIATGFHRNHMLNEEGGVIAEEFLAEYTADRVETTAAVWLGLTFNCARCHDHKFDPLTQRDFYSMKAFFHNVPERGVGIYANSIRRNAPPYLKLPAPALEASIERLNSELQRVEGELAEADKSPLERSAEEQQQRVATCLARQTEHRRLQQTANDLKKQIDAAEAAIPTTLVMEEMKEPRPTFLLLRGAYDKPGEAVAAATPSLLPAIDSSLPKNRLGLARWLVSPDNPLTARVVVNRYWQHFFGSGLVRTSEDFGAQGEPPSHPELLDWLAVSFRESGWDIKRLLRLITTSYTYRQQAQASDELHSRDPDNRLLARGPRQRLLAEVVRDQALAASGLLAAQIGGPSVKPYHPPGIYEQLTAGKGYNVYVPGTGDELYRRSLYTYWKRSVPHPAMLLFDAPFRESCTLRRSSTTTPLQALNLLNDPTYVEAARFLAARMARAGGAAIDARLTSGVQLLLARQPTAQELEILREAYHRALIDFRGDPPAAEKLLGVGETRTHCQLEASELAALTLVASTLLNLDEVIHK